MRIQNETTVHPTTGTSSTTDASSADNAADFKTLYAKKVQTLWSDYKASGLTPADQFIKARGGDELLQYKHEQENEQEQKKQRAKKNDVPRTITNTETIRKYMPDGSILVITTKNGKVTEQYRQKPKMIEVPDLVQPARPEGQSPATTQVKMKLVPHRNVFED